MSYVSGFNYKFPSDYTATVGTSSTGLTANTTDISLPTNLQPNQDAKYLITSYNQSTASDCTVIAYTKHTAFGPNSTDCWSELTRWTVEKTSSTTLGTIKDYLLEGWLLSSTQIGRLTITNVSSGSSDLNVNMYFRVTKV